MSPENQPARAHRTVGAVSMTLPFERSSAALARQELQRWMSAAGSDTESVEDARLVLTELVGNAVRHADPLGAGTMLVNWREEGGVLELSVSDGGSSTIPLQRAAPPEALDGRGLNIVDALAQRWWIERGGPRSTVHVQMAVGRSVGALAGAGAD